MAHERFVDRATELIDECRTLLFGDSLVVSVRSVLPDLTAEETF